MRTFQEFLLENEERKERERQRLEKLKDAASRGNAEAIKALQAREELKKAASVDFEAQWRSQNQKDKQ